MSQNKTCIVIGLPYYHVGFDFHEIHPELKFVQTSENALYRDCLVGFILTKSVGFGFVEIALSAETKKAKDRFKELTGKDASVYLSNMVN